MKWNYKWYLKDAVFKKNVGTVFSCFACGGGSTMGYKLAGFDVLGANEIDKDAAACYVHNHKPKYMYLEDIRKFKKRKDLPKELFNLDILDGSPPCSSFSMSGEREKKWGKTKKFREGQAEQVLDTLFFEYIDVAELLKPKVVVAENVKGLLMGNAKYYLSRIYKAFDKAGYVVNHWLLDASTMGVPQKRERVFFIAIRKDLTKYIMPLVLNFKEPIIPFKYAEIKDGIIKKDLTPYQIKYWKLTPWGKSLSFAHPKGHLFNQQKLHPNKPVPTVISQAVPFYHYSKPHFINENQVKVLQTFPLDYEHPKKAQLRYLLGMSVPPLMIAKIAEQIHEQWLSKIKKNKRAGK